jgi:tetratricopeptide (TPR) repeat protein
MSKFKIQEIQIGNTVTEYPFSLHEVVLRAVHAKTQLDNYKTPEAASVAVEAWNYLLQVRDVKQYPVLHAVAQAEYGLSLANFFNTNSKSIDIASAIQLLELTITHTSPFVQAAINGDKPRWFVALCVLYRRLFEQEGLQDLQKIDKAVEYARIAYKSSLPGSIYWSKGATNGATALHTRWRAKNSQSTEDLTEGIRMVEDVIKKSEPGTRQWAVQATILSDCLLYRFQAQGDQQDIIQAITLLEVAHTLVSPHESAIWGEIHCHLAVVLRLYAEVKCDLQILTRSIDVIHKGLQSINEVSPAWTELHQALADAFSTQAQITGSSESLDKALTIYQALTQQAHIGSLQWVVANFNYAGAAKQRYELLQRSEDLDLSISIYKEAEKHIKRDSYYWLQCQYSIGDVFHAYARLTKDGSVLAQSIQRFSSVSQALLHHPSTTLWAEAQWSLGRSYLTRFECNLPHDNESLSDIDSAIQAFSKVIEGSNSDNSITIRLMSTYRASAFQSRGGE